MFNDEVAGQSLRVDAEAARERGTMNISNRVSNRVVADRILTKWCGVRVDQLDAVHGKEAD